LTNETKQDRLTQFSKQWTVIICDNPDE